DSATVTVTFIPPPIAGTDGILDLCQNDTTTVNLFDSLGGTPDTGGTWSPALTSGSGVFNPNVDSAGVYTYTVASTNTTCDDDSATVIVNFIPNPSAGTDAILNLCQNDTTTVNLFDSLGGTPDTGGTWSPALASGSGIFDPNVDSAGVYTYTVTGSNSACEDDSATVTVSFIPNASAGSDAILDLCQDDTTTVNLFDSLGGTPDTGGTWSPALASGSGIFNPNVDSDGVYTYTVTSSNPVCENDSATVTVTFIQPPIAGTDGTIDLCQNDTTTVNLFDSLGGTPDTGGTWSPALTSGSGIFDPNVDPPGVYSYTVNQFECNLTDSSEIIITIFQNPIAGTDGTIDLCQNDSTTVNLFDSLGGTPDTGGTWSPALASGSGIFDPNVDPDGVYTYTVISSNPACDDDSATVTVTFIPNTSAGTDGVLNLCQDDTTTVNLFDSLGGTPDTGGTWSPALASGSSVFNPNVDSAGVYTYTVTSTDPTCEDDSATVTVNFIPNASAGTDAILNLCQNDTTTVNLFDSLGGTPDTGGTWSPALASGSGIFNPNVDPAGVYTYTVTSSNPVCDDNSANIIVNFIPNPSAGTDAILNLCQDDTTTVNLFDSLGGTPDTGGIWSPALASGSGVFNPNVDSAGMYTYTVASTNTTCDDDSATVIVNFIPNASAGTDAILNLCQNDTTTVNLFDSLGGTPDTGGIWSPALASGSDIFDPNVDPAGVYTYTVTSTNPVCDDDSSSVIVNFIPNPSAGTDAILTLCQDDTTSVDLFDSLGGMPDTGGIWSPALASGSGIFDPNIDPAGVYTYTVDQAECNLADSSEITVTFVENPDITGLIINIPNICAGQNLNTSLSNMDLLLDGDYVITYDIMGMDNFTETQTIEITNGVGNFIIPETNFSNVGLYEFILVDFYNVNTNCQADLSNVQPFTFEIFESITPELSENGNFFCTNENATIQNLTNNIITDGSVEWYSTQNGNELLNNDYLLQDSESYYASITTDNGCSSIDRLEVIVNIGPCDEDLLIPDGFSPNGDGINDTFVINNLEELYPNFKLTIYNRNGNKLYKGDINSPRWNGTTTTSRVGGGVVPIGVYFYILEFNDGIRSKKQGRVYLSR
ncbi:gliding motility-associated C-terminal domain-containing protein, partial [Psychroserpens mesophilus]|uniref:T9SS type B sorting domain-containing protein n=1 Tax=Psychroserpens mesophilus TaxID=325473 RepID=UPI003D65401F